MSTFFWKGIIQDCKEYVNLCPICTKTRGGRPLKLIPKQIITRGARERYVVDGWQIYNQLALETGYKWVIDIIDYFSKYMGSFPVADNNAKNALVSIKEFCIYIGFPKILQTDNGSEYCNDIIDAFCTENNIKHIEIQFKLCYNNI